MAITAENLAKKYGVSREECDEFALDESGARACRRRASGYFAEEIVPVRVPGPKGATTLVEKDEGPRTGLTMEKLGKLAARFVEDGVVTPGNASGITDGAAAVVLTTRKRAEADGLPWLGRLVSASVVGVDPAIMGIGPAFSIPGRARSAPASARATSPCSRSTKRSRRRCLRVCARCARRRRSQAQSARRRDRARPSAGRLGRAPGDHGAARTARPRRRLRRRVGVHRRRPRHRSRLSCGVIRGDTCVIGRVWDALALLVIAFALWKIFVAPRSFSARRRTSGAARGLSTPRRRYVSRRRSSRARRSSSTSTRAGASRARSSFRWSTGWLRAHPGATVAFVDVGEPRKVAAAFARRYSLGRGRARSAASAHRRSSACEGFPTIVVDRLRGHIRAKWEGLNPAIGSR